MVKQQKKPAEKAKRTLPEILRSEFDHKGIQSSRLNGPQVISNDLFLKKVYGSIIHALQERPAVLTHEFEEAYRDLMSTGEMKAISYGSWSLAYTRSNSYIKKAVESGEIKSMKLREALNRPEKKTNQISPSKRIGKIYWRENPNRPVSVQGNVYYQNEDKMHSYVSKIIAQAGKMFNFTLP